MRLNITWSNFTYSDQSLIGCCLNEDLQISCSEWIDTKDCSKLNILVEDMLKQIFGRDVQAEISCF